MPRYDDSIKEEARVFFLQGMGYKTIANKLKEQYNNSVAHNTIKRWAKQGNWHKLLDQQREVIKQETASNGTRSNIKNISQLKNSTSEIRAYEMVSVIRELQRLEGAKDLQDTLIQEVADKMPEAMKRAGLSQEQINLVIRNWVEMVRDLE